MGMLRAKPLAGLLAHYGFMLTALLASRLS